MTADVNWLLTSVAQGSAAMIAIVGGLLVSRYVGLHAEQQAAQRRADDLASRASLAAARVRLSRREFAEFAANEMLHDTRVLKATFDVAIDVDRAFALAGTERAQFDEDIVADQLDRLRDEMALARTTLLGRVPSVESPPSWSTFWADNLDLPVVDASVWDFAYQSVAVAKLDDLVSAYDVYSAAVVRPGLQERRYTLEAWAVPIALEGRTRIQERIASSEADEAALRYELRLAHEHRDSSRQPEGFSLALQVLTAVAVLGVAVPVVIMAFEVTRLDVWIRVGVVGLFFAGVALLLRFLFAYASFLREGGRRTLPRTIFGLLWKERRAVEKEA